MAEKLAGKAALALAAEGASVAISGRRTDRLEALAKSIMQRGGMAKAFAVDVSVENQARGMVADTNAAFGQLGVLVNDARVILLGPVANADTEDWRRMIETNVLGLIYTAHAALPLMRAQSSGRVINIFSVAGRTARAGVYNTSK